MANARFRSSIKAGFALSHFEKEDEMMFRRFLSCMAMLMSFFLLIDEASPQGAVVEASSDERRMLIEGVAAYQSSFLNRAIEVTGSHMLVLRDAPPGIQINDKATFTGLFDSKHFLVDLRGKNFRVEKGWVGSQYIEVTYGAEQEVTRAASTCDRPSATVLDPNVFGGFTVALGRFYESDSEETFLQGFLNEASAIRKRIDGDKEVYEAIRTLKSRREICVFECVPVVHAVKYTSEPGAGSAATSFSSIEISYEMVAGKLLPISMTRKVGQTVEQADGNLKIDSLLTAVSKYEIRVVDRVSHEEFMPVVPSSVELEDHCPKSKKSTFYLGFPFVIALIGFGLVAAIFVAKKRKSA